MFFTKHICPCEILKILIKLLFLNQACTYKDIVRAPTLCAVLSMGSVGQCLGVNSVMSVGPHSRDDHSSVIKAFM